MQYLNYIYFHAKYVLKSKIMKYNVVNSNIRRSYMKNMQANPAPRGMSGGRDLLRGHDMKYIYSGMV